MASLSITAVRLLAGLKYSKAEGAIVTVRTEFGKRVGTESPEYAAQGGQDVELNHTTAFEVATETSAGVEEVANSRAILHFSEVTKGDKKKKGDSVQPLGWAEVDLVALVGASLEFATTVSVHPAVADENPALAKVEVKVAVSRALLSPQQLETGNLLTITVGGIFALPDSWPVGPPGAPTHTYTLSLPVPSSVDADRTVQLTGGVVLPPRPDIEPDMGDLDGDFKSGDDVTFVRDSQQKRNAVRFPTSVLRVYLGPDALQRMLARLPVTRVVPVELRRFALGAAAGKGSKGKKGDEEEAVYHGVCFVPATPLLYPGTSRINGAYQFRPYSEADFADRMRLAGEGGDPSRAMSVRRSKVPDSGVAKGGDPEEPAADQRLFAALSLALSRPLVARRPAAALVAQIAELIPPRAPVPRVHGNEARAVSEYQAQIASVANMLLDEYRRTAAEEDPRNVEQIRQRLVFDLNVSGKYHSLKEQLKHSIIKIVREKFLHTSAISDPTERHAFLGQLYVFLGEAMHKSLAAHFSFAQTEPAVLPPLTADRLRHAAHEAEVLADPARASRLYQDLVTRHRSDVAAWLAYGLFAARAGDCSRAELCFREVLAMDQTHLPALLAAAALALVNHRVEDANTLYEAASVVYPDSILAWTARAIFFDATGNDISKSMALLQARKAADAASPSSSIFLLAADHFTELGLSDLSERALAHEPNTSSSAFHLALARTYAAAHPPQHDKVEAEINIALQTDYHNRLCWAVLGAALRISNPAKARDALQHCIDLPEPASADPDTLLLLASLLAQGGEHERAKEMYIRYCHLQPSAVGWEGVGCACLRLGLLDDARDALAEANAYDNTNAKVWGYLAVVCARLKQKIEAEQSFKFAMKLGLQDAALLAEIKQAQAEAGLGNPFESPLTH